MGGSDSASWCSKSAARCRLRWQYAPAKRHPTVSKSKPVNMSYFWSSTRKVRTLAFCRSISSRMRDDRDGSVMCARQRWRKPGIWRTQVFKVWQRSGFISTRRKEASWIWQAQLASASRNPSNEDSPTESEESREPIVGHPSPCYDSRGSNGSNKETNKGPVNPSDATEPRQCKRLNFRKGQRPARACSPTTTLVRKTLQRAPSTRHSRRTLPMTIWQWTSQSSHRCYLEEEASCQEMRACFLPLNESAPVSNDATRASSKGTGQGHSSDPRS
jgi:hypothetical protein